MKNLDRFLFIMAALAVVLAVTMTWFLLYMRG